MEEKGLIYRRTENGNRRSLHVYLTDEGWEKQKLVRQTLETLTRDVLSDMTAKEQAALLDGLKKLCEKMCNTEGLQ